MTMKRLATPLVVASALALGMLPSDAQPTGKVFRVGILNFESVTTAQSKLNAFREELRALGYEEGRNLVIESRFAQRRP